MLPPMFVFYLNVCPYDITDHMTHFGRFVSLGKRIRKFEIMKRRQRPGEFRLQFIMHI